MSIRSSQTPIVCFICIVLFTYISYGSQGCAPQAPVREPKVVEEHTSDSRREQVIEHQEKIRESRKIEKTKERVQERREENIALDADLDGGHSEYLPETAFEKKPDFVGPRFSFRVTGGVEDTVPPKLLGVTIRPKKVHSGDWIRIEIQVGKDLSGIAGAQITLESPSKKHSLYIDTSYHPSKKVFYATAQISRFVEKGIWTVQRLNLLDRASNPSVYLGTSPQLKGVNLVIESLQQDTVPPVVRAFSLLPSKPLRVGEDVPFSIVIKDDNSGVASVEVTATQQGTGYTVRSERLYLPEAGSGTTPKFVGVLRVPLTHSFGSWSISRIDFQDRAGNYGSLSTSDALLKGKTFSFSNGVQPPVVEKRPPSLLSGLLSSHLVHAGEAVRLTLDAKDSGGSGLRWVEAHISDPMRRIRYQFNLFFNAALGLWEGSSQHSFFTTQGIWSVGRIQLYDRAGNERSYLWSGLQSIPLLSSSRVRQVVSTFEHLALDVSLSSIPPSDRKKPLLLGVHLAPGRVSPGGIVRVYAQIKDPSGRGISSASCTFVRSQGPGSRYVTLDYNSDTGFFEGELRVSNNASSDSWWMSGCYISSRVGLSASISGRSLVQLQPLDISRATSNPSPDPFVFSVVGASSSKDTKPPLWTEVNVAPYSVFLGDGVRVYAKISDLGGGHVHSGRCSFTAARIQLRKQKQFDARSMLSVDFAYNPAHKLWEGTLRIPLNASRGEWWLQSCTWRDSSGNQAIYDAFELSKVARLKLPQDVKGFDANAFRSFVVKGKSSSQDVLSPTLLSVRSAPLRASPGTSIRVFVKAKDNVSIAGGFCSIKPSILEGSRSSYGAAHLEWNPMSRLWEGDFRIPALAQGGIWSLAGCQLTDSSGNVGKWNALQIRSIPALDLSSVASRTLVKRTSVSVQAGPGHELDVPSVSSVKWLPHSTVRAGESLLLTVRASDPTSPISVVQAVIESPTQKKTIRLNLRYNPGTKQFESSISFPRNVEDGIWKIVRISISDVYRNRKEYSSKDPLLSQATVGVTGTIPTTDRLAPAIHSIVLSKAVVLAGQSVRVAVKATDDTSGVSSVRVDMTSPSKAFSASSFCTFNGNTKLWEGEIKIPKRGEDGAWSILTIVAQDRLGRVRQVSGTEPVASKVVLTVRGSSAPSSDKEAPQISNIEIFPSTVKAGEKIRIAAKVMDALSGVSSVSIQMENEKQTQNAFIQLTYNPVTHLFESTYLFPFYAAPGTWRISQIELRDRAGNQRTMDRNGSFLP